MPAATSQPAPGAVSAADPRVARVGAELLGAGGNAVDAAVGCAFAIGVVEPFMSGIGGGSWLVAHDRAGADAEVFAGPILAPAAAHEAMFTITGDGPAAGPYGWPQVVDDANILGARSVGVPGTVAALCAAHAARGRLPMTAVMAPAIALAEGHDVNWYASAMVCGEAVNLRRFEATARLFLPDGLPLRQAGLPGATALRQPELAATLEAIATLGPDVFYHEAARPIVATLTALGGMLSIDDLAGYRAMRYRTAPTRVGSALLFGPRATGFESTMQVLRLLAALRAHHPERPDLQLWAVAQQAAFTDRLRHARADQTASWEWIAGAEHAAEVAAAWTPGSPPSADTLGRAGCTSHLSVVDDQGMIVSLTQTVLDLFGSRIVEPATGVLLNDGMMYFDPRPGRPNSIAPGKPGLSAVSPVVVELPGSGRAGLGASGGRRIITAVAQIADRLLRGDDLRDAIDAPRVHCEGGEVWIGDGADGTAEAKAGLEAGDLRVTVAAETPTSWLFARPNGVFRSETGQHRAAADRSKPWGTYEHD